MHHNPIPQSIVKTAY